MEEISLQTARSLALAAQGLDHAPLRPAAKEDVLAVIRRMGLLQIDTIHVVARSPYLALWSRLGDYRCEWLDELLAAGSLVEVWSHAMCFAPAEDYPLHRRRILEAKEGGKWPVQWAVRWGREHLEVMEQVRARMRENGSVRSAEFESKDRPPGGWWNWKEEKNALEAMFFTGEAMIARRHNFQRIYALRESVLPDWDDARLPSIEEAQRTLVQRAVYHLGVALAGWIPDYFRQPKTGMPQRLKALVAEGLLQQVKIEGFKDPAYLHPERLPLLETAASGQPSLTTLLSPFDPLVWDRRRASELFGFDYLIECYTPAAKRRYGYFTLPILQRGRLVGRLDPKAHRKQGVFEVKALHLEPGVAPSAELAADLAGALQRLANWHGTPEVVVRQSDPPGFDKMVSEELQLLRRS